jgi:hypothetical protein
LKAVRALAPEHQAQIINYLNATSIEVGLLINFGNPRLEYKRFTRSKTDRIRTPPSCPSCTSMLVGHAPDAVMLKSTSTSMDRMDRIDAM